MFTELGCFSFSFYCLCKQNVIKSFEAKMKEIVSGRVSRTRDVFGNPLRINNHMLRSPLFAEMNQQSHVAIAIVCRNANDEPRKSEID